MKNRNVIVIVHTNGDFIFASDFPLTLDYTDNIKFADEFESTEKAEKRISELGKSDLSVKKFSYQVDKKFLFDATNINETV